MTRMVEPQADIERMSEEEGTTDRHDMREMERGAKTLACDVPSRGRSSSSGKRKKQHWQVSPYTRVRVRQRIRRWGGYLYNIDLFQYVERRLLDFIA